ncbi:hypothetical protein KQI65_13455 [bacterium]|nr:hypothetical protein [bacterium]
MNSTLHAGYILPGVFDALLRSDAGNGEFLREYLYAWCAVDMQTDVDTAGKQIDDPVLLVAANLVSRGLPTLPGAQLQKKFDDVFGRTASRETHTGRLESFPSEISSGMAGELLEVLRAVDPRVSDRDALYGIMQSKAAGILKVLLKPLQQVFGSAIGHLLQVDEDGAGLRIPFPVAWNGMLGIHARVARKSDTAKAGVREDGWFELPVENDVDKLTEILKGIKGMLPDSALPLAVQDERMLRAEGGDALQLLLSPLAAARLQAAFLAFLLTGQLDLAAERLRIVVVERDVPAAALAFDDLGELLTALFQIEGKGRTLPVLEISVLSQGVFADSRLHESDSVRLVKKGNELPEADCCFDLGMLLRSGVDVPPPQCSAKITATLRTARMADARRLRFGTPRAWGSAGSKKDATVPAGVTGAELEKQGEALEHILLRVFRLSKLRDTQREMVSGFIAQRSAVVATAAGSGKSLMMLLSGLLQPAPTVVIAPFPTTVLDQQEFCNRNFIDAVVPVPESFGKARRLRSLERLRKRESLFCLLSAELYCSVEVMQTLSAMAADKILFAQAVVEEAQCLSEWSQDFLPSLQLTSAFAAHTLPAGKDAVLPLRFLTGDLGYEILADLLRQLAAAGRQYAGSRVFTLRGESTLHDAQQYYVLAVDCDSSETEHIAARKGQALKKFIPGLPAFLEELQSGLPAAKRIPAAELQNFFGRRSRHAGILYCTTAEGPFGVLPAPESDKAALGFADPLGGIDTLRIGTFIGRETAHQRISRQIVEENELHLRQFREGEYNLLASTRAFAVGTSSERIRYTLHVNQSAGVSRFIQESMRAGKDGRLALSVLLYTLNGKASGKDVGIAENQLHNMHSTSAKEKQLLHDLLREITYPEDSNTGRIANILADEFGIDARVSYWQRALDERMYLHEGARTVGYVDLVTHEIVPDGTYPVAGFAAELLAFAHAVGMEAAGSGPSLSSWVAATFPSDVDDGISRQLADFERGATFTLRLGFENDREPLLTQIHKVLWREADIQIQRKLLSEVSTATWGDFCAELELRSGKTGAFDSLSDTHRDRMLHYFNKLRSRSDTERVIHRLAVLGVVERFTVNQAARTFSLTMRVTSEAEYREALERYMRIGLPYTHVARKLEALTSYPGETVLEQCLYMLIDHSYQHPVAHQFAQLTELDSICRLGALEGPAAYRHALSVSVRGRYARNDALPATLSATDLQRLQVIESYIRLMEEDSNGNILGNADHLKHSTVLLAADYPGEPLLDALDAFAGLLLARDEKEWESLGQHFIEHVTRCAAAEQLIGDAYLAAIDPWAQALRRYFTQEQTQKLRAGLEAAVSRIAQGAERKPVPTSTARPPVQDPMPDISADRKVQQEKVASAEAKAAEAKAAEAKAAEAKAAEAKAAEAKAAEAKAAEAKAAEAKAAEAKAAEAKAAEAKAAEAKAVHPDIRPASDKPGDAGKPMPRSKTEARRERPLTPPPETSRSEEDILREMERELEEKARRLSAGSSAPGESAKQSTGKDAQKSKATRTTQARGKTDAEIDGLLSEIEHALQGDAETKAKRSAAPPAEEVDPDLTYHLKWLKSFNTTFLNAYETRYPRLTPGTRKRA